MKAYNISEVAGMFGISSGLLRHYELRGLIAPLRKKSGYRSYTVPDIYTLSGIRLLRNAGYTLEEIETMLDADYEQTLTLKQSRCEELEREIDYLRMKLASIENDRDAFALLHENDGAIELVSSPAVLRINNQINDAFSFDNSGILKWVEHLPIVRVSPAFSMEAILNGLNEVRFGYAVPLELADRLGLDSTPCAETKPSVKCIKTTVHSYGTSYLGAHMLKHVLEFCQSHGYAICGDAWGFTLGMFMEQSQQRRYHTLYVPVSVDNGN